MSRKAYVTLLTAPGYLPGVLVLHDCLVSVGSRFPLVVMATPSLNAEARDVVAKRGIGIRDIDHLYPADGKHVLADHDSRFRDTWTKLKYVTFGAGLDHRWTESVFYRAFDLVEYEVRRDV